MSNAYVNMRGVYFGVVADENKLTDTRNKLRQFLRQVARNPDIVRDPEIVGDIINAARGIVGIRLSDWLNLNFNNGRSPRRDLIKAIILTLADDTDSTLLKTRVKIDFNIVCREQTLATEDLPESASDSPLIKAKIADIKNDDLYRLLELLGAEYFAKLFAIFSEYKNG